MWFVILLFLLAYWLLYSPHYPFRPAVAREATDSSSSLPPQPQLTPPFSFSVTREGPRTVSVSASYGGSWRASWDDDRYAFEDGRAFETDPCFGQPDGSRLPANGRPLYEFAQSRGLEDLGRGEFYFFYCDRDRIRGLYACPVGRDCYRVDGCTTGETYEDLVDRAHFRVCSDGKLVRKPCPTDTFFWNGACRSASEVCSDRTPFHVDERTFIRCDGEEARVETCPERTARLEGWPACEPDACLDVPDGLRAPMAEVTSGPLTYSPGYHACRDRRVVETVHCPSEWTDSRGDDLTRLPKVYDPKLGDCAVPSFCENVRPTDPATVVVPVHEFTKSVSSWRYAAIFDSTVGYRCNGGSKTRFAVEPGQRIVDNAVVSACDYDAIRKIPIGDRVDAYYDCESRKVVDCGPDAVFQGRRCKKRIARAHRFKNMPIFRAAGLSPRNDWMEAYQTRPHPPRDRDFVSAYDTHSDPECRRFAFLKQMPKGTVFYLPDGKHYCTYDRRRDRVVKKSYDLDARKLRFWSQRLVPLTEGDEEPCESGVKVETGNFFLDSTVYKTCERRQPFVFCPSASTRGIDRTPNGTFACVPDDATYSFRARANETVRCLTAQVGHFRIGMWSSYHVDGGSGVEYVSDDDVRSVTVLSSEDAYRFWSDQPYEVHYLRLPTYPPNAYLDTGRLVAGRYGYWMRKRKETEQPLALPDHAIEESIYDK